LKNTNLNRTAYSQETHMFDQFTYRKNNDSAQFICHTRDSQPLSRTYFATLDDSGFVLLWLPEAESGGRINGWMTVSSNSDLPSQLYLCVSWCLRVPQRPGPTESLAILYASPSNLDSIARYSLVLVNNTNFFILVSIWAGTLTLILSTGIHCGKTTIFERCLLLCINDSNI
jgi:hypothetical protein